MPVMVSERDEVVIFALKVDQFAAVRSPLFAAEADGRFRVHVAEEELILKSVPLVELASVIALCLLFHKVVDAVGTSAQPAVCESTPVTLSYSSPVTVSEMDDVVIFALNVAQFADERYPDCDAVDVGREIVFPEMDKGPTTVDVTWGAVFVMVHVGEDDAMEMPDPAESVIGDCLLFHISALAILSSAKVPVHTGVKVS